MKYIVFDTSAYLTLIQEENGSKIVENYLSRAVFSAVNYAELLTVLKRSGMSIDVAKKISNSLVRKIIPFDSEQALISSQFYLPSLGLSLGDRACLALAKYKNIPVLTADKIWGEIDTEIEIKLLR